MEKLSRDKTGVIIQGFEPSKIIEGTTYDVSGIVAFRVGSDVNYKFDSETTLMPLSKNSITVCTKMSTITFDASIIFEVMEG